MKLQESGETYLETILLLEQQQESLRAVDLAGALDYSKASVSRALGILKREGLLQVLSGGEIQLTPAGRERAAAIYERHCVIARFLEITLGVTRTVAEPDACRIEHIISQPLFARMKEFVEQQSAREQEPSERENRTAPS